MGDTFIFKEGLEGFTNIFAAVINLEALYMAAFPLKSYFELLEALKSVTLILDNKDIGNIGVVVLKGDKILTPIKTSRGDRTINIAVNELHRV